MARLPYGRQWIGDEEIRRVSEVLASDWITQGPKVEEFETAFARATGARYAVAFANGTLALAGMCAAAGFGPGDEVITSPLTFVATANAVLQTGAIPVFADIDPGTGNLDPDRVAEKIGTGTKAILAVDYAGHPCDYGRLEDLARQRGLLLLDDAAHALGGSYRGRPVGSISAMSAFSFHPVKPIATGEGGMVVTSREDFASRLREYRNHGIVREPSRMSRFDGPWYYEVRSPGTNARLTDIQCALGLEQLKRLDGFIRRRRAIADRYREAFGGRTDLLLTDERPGVEHAYHLFVIRTVPGRTKGTRKDLFEELQRRGLGVQVHYVPVPDHPYYRERLGTTREGLDRAFQFYETCISIPLYPLMSDEDAEFVVREVLGALDTLGSRHADAR